MTQSNDPADVYRQLGVTPVITASGSTTVYGGSKLLPEVKEAIETARAYTDKWEQETGKVIPFVFHHQGHQFAADDGGFYETWRAACKKAGVLGRNGKHKILHDCRRSSARRMDRDGISRDVAKRLGGWKTDEMYSRYRIVRTKDLRQAVKKMATEDAKT